ncbi:MAG: dockerin type I repeat-containing protein [Clostridia bacterium]|nr:dockerin type I repeat-containing protein [Clostridia bacterium]
MKKVLSIVLSAILCAIMVSSMITGVFANPDEIAGDINKDRIVDNKDVVTLFRYLNGNISADVNKAACDTNGDGLLNNKDVVVLFRYVCDPASVTIYYGNEGGVIVSESEWKKAYADYVKTKKDDYVGFTLIYLDDDSVPELLLIGSCEADGEIICTYHNGTVKEQALDRLYGAKYIPYSGLIKNTNGNMGILIDEVFKLENGQFNLLISGVYDYFYEGQEKYEIDGKEVSEATYNQKFNQVFDNSAAVHAENNEMTYSQLMKELSTY